MKYIFWNTNKKKDINKYIEKLLVEYTPDFLGLAEYEADGKEVESDLQKTGYEYAYIPRIASRLDIFYKGKSHNVIHCADNRYYTIKRIPYKRVWQIISVVHLPSKRYQDPSTNAEILRDMLGGINSSREKVSTNKVVIVGDFNMNPFEAPMVEASSLQAISSKNIVVNKKEREFKEKKREFFYNPMWNFLGDEKYPIGSYYHSSPLNAAMYWNTFDQFIVNNELADDVDLTKIKFIDCIDNILLVNKEGKPKISDHFPLYFEIGEQI